jgi:hypothetical protein
MQIYKKYKCKVTFQLDINLIDFVICCMFSGFSVFLHITCIHTTNHLHTIQKQKTEKPENIQHITKSIKFISSWKVTLHLYFL